MAMERKTQFSLACGLLSKMVKQQQQQQQQGISFDGCTQTHRPPPLTTMDLLSGIDVSADDTKEMEMEMETETETETETEKAPQLTIFYDGKMFVFDDVVEEKANDLMKMASCCSDESCAPPAKLSHLLAQTRKASLHRFLNKRKERIIANAQPYQKKETRSWLALGQ